MTGPFLPDGKLEAGLRDHYRAITPATDPELGSRIAQAIDAAPSRTHKRVERQLVALAAVIALLAAALLVPRFLPAIGPEVTNPFSGPTGSGPAFDATKALRASVQPAGQTRSGGLWAIESDYLLNSTDNGATWRAGHVSLPVYAIDVLDASHAWTVSGGAYRGLVVTPWAGTMPPVGSIVVNRTADGGATWKSVQFEQGDCDSVELSFVDADRGFLMCRGTAGSSDTGPATILATVDGGATWTVAGANLSLGPNLVAVDASTLWTSAPTGGPAGHIDPMVSRDGGATWAAVSLPEATSLEDAAGIEVRATPLWWNGRNGALAVDITWYGQPKGPQEWFYRTADGGRTWSLLKVDRQMSLSRLVGEVVGPVWAVLDPSFVAGKTSSDFGASWSSFDSAGLPPNRPWNWLSFADARHGAGLIYVGDYLPSQVLFLTSDGGQSWQPADFGDARTSVSAVPASDQAIATQTASDFQVDAFKAPTAAWAMLSSYSQEAYGSEPAFESAEATLAAASNHQFTAGPAARDSSLLNADTLGSAVWSDLNSNAILARAYVARVTYSAGPVRSRLLVVAPVSGSGEWRVWVVGAASGK